MFSSHGMLCFPLTARYVFLSRHVFCIAMYRTLCVDKHRYFRLRQRRRHADNKNKNNVVSGPGGRQRGGGEHQRLATIAAACVGIVRDCCALLRLSDPRRLVMEMESASKTAAATAALQGFAGDIIALLLSSRKDKQQRSDRPRRRSKQGLISRDGNGLDENWIKGVEGRRMDGTDDQNGVYEEMEIETVSMARALDFMRDDLRELRMLRNLSTAPARVLHSVLMQVRLLAGATDVGLDGVVPAMRNIHRHYSEVQGFLSLIRERFGMNPLASVEELTMVMNGYLDRVGLPYASLNRDREE